MASGHKNEFTRMQNFCTQNLQQQKENEEYFYCIYFPW